MNDLEWDALQKKRIARQEKYHNRKKRGCTLPSDSLSEAQKRKLNGEVKTMNLNEPMTWEEFKTLPKSMAEYYYNRIVERFGVGSPSIARMMGVGEATVRQYANNNNLILEKVKGKPSKANLAKFAEFCNHCVQEAREENPAETEDQAEKKTEKSSQTSQLCRMAFEWHEVNSMDEILRFLGHMPLPNKARIRITIEEYKDDLP